MQRFLWDRASTAQRNLWINNSQPVCRKFDREQDSLGLANCTVHLIRRLAHLQTDWMSRNKVEHNRKKFCMTEFIQEKNTLQSLESRIPLVFEGGAVFLSAKVDVWVGEHSNRPAYTGAMFDSERTAPAIP